MYLHLGNDLIIKEEGIIGIYDIDKTTISKRTRNFLESFEKKGRLIYCTDDLPKSFIVYDDGDGLLVYVSQISTNTLLKRSNFLKNIGENNV